MVKKQYHNKVAELFEQSRSAVSYMENYGCYLSKLLSDLDYNSVTQTVDCLLTARKHSSTIFFVGNGGSAATASHFAQDIAEIGRKVGRPGFKTISLADNLPYITALANDYGYESIFAWQMAELFKKGDVLVAISASGNSPNIINAAKCAKKLGGVIVGLVGFDGGKLKEMCNYVIHVRTRRGEYGPVEDVHMILDHMITTYLSVSLKR